MNQKIDFYSSLNSIWTYIGFEAIQEYAQTHDISFSYKILHQWRLFESTGGTPLRKRHLARQRWRDFEIKRWCAKRGVKLDPTSQFMLADKVLGEKVAIAAIVTDHSPVQFLRLALRAIWSEARDISNPETVLEIADRAGLPGRDLMAYSSRSEIDDIYETNLKDAIAANVFGTPSFVRQGEVFWGQDHLDALAEAVTSNRAPFSPLL